MAYYTTVLSVTIDAPTNLCTVLTGSGRCLTYTLLGGRTPYVVGQKIPSALGYLQR